MTAAVVQLSGGVGSYFALVRAAEKYGWPNVVALFADVLIEDDDLYRFVDDVADEIVDNGGRFERLAEGRDPWTVFFDVRFLGNTLVDPCSRILKRELLRGRLEELYPIADGPDVRVILGFDWTEEHRFKRAAPRHAPYVAEAPLCDPPLREKATLLDELVERGHTVPRLYRVGGFSHNNCGGFCVKGGHATFRRLLEVFPDRYAYHERREQELRAFLDADVAILRHRSGPLEGQALTLRDFRLGLEAKAHARPTLFVYDQTDRGSCACADGSDDDRLPIETVIELRRKAG